VQPKSRDTSMETELKLKHELQLLYLVKLLENELTLKPSIV
jgi:hypothetical protein